MCVCVQVEQQLIKRLSFAVLAWTLVLKGETLDGGSEVIDTTGGQQLTHLLGGTPQLQVIVRGRCQMEEKSWTICSFSMLVV